MSLMAFALSIIVRVTEIVIVSVVVVRIISGIGRINALTSQKAPA